MTCGVRCGVRRERSAYEQFVEKPDQRRLYDQERLLVEVSELLVQVMSAENISRAQLARRLGKSKAFVTQVLRGNQNMTLRTITDLFGAMNYEVSLSSAPRAGEVLHDLELATWLDCWKVPLIPVSISGQIEGPGPSTHRLKGILQRTGIYQGAVPTFAA
jgi:transcriptional regulator with XRE-family HTH domain